MSVADCGTLRTIVDALLQELGLQSEGFQTDIQACEIELFGTACTDYIPDRVGRMINALGIRAQLLAMNRRLISPGRCDATLTCDNAEVNVKQRRAAFQSAPADSKVQRSLHRFHDR